MGAASCMTGSGVGRGTAARSSHIVRSRGPVRVLIDVFLTLLGSGCGPGLRSPVLAPRLTFPGGRLAGHQDVTELLHLSVRVDISDYLVKIGGVGNKIGDIGNKIGDVGDTIGDVGDTIGYVVNVERAALAPQPVEQTKDDDSENGTNFASECVSHCIITAAAITSKNWKASRCGRKAGSNLRAIWSGSMLL
jgi:hypothetical protein